MVEPGNKQASEIIDRVSQNRDALVLTIANAISQIDEFRETVRGLNGIDPEYRESLLSFLDNLKSKLEGLLHDLPLGQQIVSIKRAYKIADWLHDYRSLISVEATKYLRPENVVQATIPTGLILACTGVGALFGFPVAGTVVGGLITGQLKPGKAADNLFGQSRSSGND